MEKLNAAIERLEKFKREHGRYTLEEAALFISERTGEPYEGMKSQLTTAVENGDLKTYSPESFTKNYSKINRDFYEHVYWHELNDWLEKTYPNLDCKFPKPDAPTAKVEAGTVTSPSIEAWKSNARQIGEKIHKEKPSLNVEKIAEKTHNEMTNRKAKGEVRELLQSLRMLLD